jgi:hypothetical protein
VNPDGRDTIVTGCLQQGSSAQSYVLVQTPGTSVPHGGVGTVGGRPQQGLRYELVGTRTDLAKLVGRRVEVTGSTTITPGAAGTPRAGDRGGDAPIAGGNDKDLQGRRTGDAARDGDSRPGLGHESRRGSPGDVSLSRFTVKSIKETGPSC